MEEQIGKLVVGTECEDSLLKQLEDSVNNTFDSRSSSGGTGKSGSKAPVALNSVSLLDAIENEARDFIPGRYESLSDRILGLLSMGLGNEDRRTVTIWLESVVERIRNLFQPVRLVEVCRPCPECLAQYAYTESGGQLKRSLALVGWVDPQTEQLMAYCHACGADWIGLAEVLQLGKALTAA